MLKQVTTVEVIPVNSVDVIPVEGIRIVKEIMPEEIILKKVVSKVKETHVDISISFFFRSN